VAMAETVVRPAEPAAVDAPTAVVPLDLAVDPGAPMETS
jgi:hypothetical protein